MATTIQVAEATIAELRRVKDETGASSYDVVLQRLLMEHRKRVAKLVGLTPGILPFERERGHRD